MHILVHLGAKGFRVVRLVIERSQWGSGLVWCLPVGYCGVGLGNMPWILLVDFGLLVLIWMIQLVVYPSFKYFSSTALLQWHRHYTARITVVVMPLMIAQVVLHAYRCYADFTLSNAWLLLLVISTWITTVTIFVPLHNQITAADALPATLTKLVNYNWIRTATWSVIFLWQECIV